MKRIFKKVIVLLILGAFFVALPLEITGLIRNEKAFKSEAEEKIEYTIKSSAVELNTVFNSMESLVNMLQALVSTTFTYDIYSSNYNKFQELKKQSSIIIKQTLEKTPYISGMHITFNPELHFGREEIYYAYKNGRVSFINSAKLAQKWIEKGDPASDYYFKAIKYGKYWCGLDYESSIDAYLASYTKSVYDINGTLIGIVGSDIRSDEIVKIIKAMRIYDDSQIILYGKDLTLYAHNIPAKNTEKYFSALSSQISLNNKENDCIWYKAYDGKKHIAAYTTLNNGWILVATQPETTVMTSAADTRKTLLITMLLTIVVIIGFTAILIRRYYGPVVESAEQNEIIIINQSRQAKLGEMIGNIAHQCKQPLNSINIDIANMKDDYYASELSPENFDRYTEKMKDNITIMSDTITDFADFLKPDRKKETFLINDVIEKVLSMMAESLKINKIKVEFNADRKISVTNYRNELTQCIFNILENARDAASASPPDARQISIELSEDFAEKMIHINIFNTGSVISEEAGRHIFTPYFSTKEAKGGTGLGLYLTKQIIENHFNGRVYYTNNDEGVTFTIEFKEI